ncbi:MAG: hypothetical protein V3T84_07940 [Phycisphaerales bacterium]
MIELEISESAPEISKLLLARGTALPAVQWQHSRSSTAKKTLDAMDDAQIFAPTSLKNQSMSAAVRALLYLWNGWIDESTMYAQGARPKESLFILAISERHRGRAHEAKAFFRQLNDHSIYPSLVQISNELIGSSPDESLKRFREILNLNGAWEPYAFISLYETARLDETKLTVGEFVREMQRQEFALLFGHCFQAATGEEVTKRKKPQAQPTAPKRKHEDLAAKRDRLIRQKMARWRV